MADEKKRSAWHSEIVNRSPLVLTFTAGPRKSNFADKPDYARFTDTDGMDRMLNIENAAVRGALESVPLNVPVAVTAEGSRDGATLRWAPTNGVTPNKPQPKPTQPNAAPQQVPQQQYAPQANMDPAELLAAALGAAHEAVALYRQRYEGTEYVLDAGHFQSLATAVFIAACRREVTLAPKDDTQGAWLDLGAKLEEATVLGALTDAEKQRVEAAIASQNAEKIAAATEWIGGKIEAARKAAESDSALPF